MKLSRSFALVVFLFSVGPNLHAEKVTLRVGHFPNITHPQALVARQLQRQGKGWFQERLGPEVDIQWFVYNAGPSAMEAIFAGSIDLTYVGPGPVLNAYLKARGSEIRVVSGAAKGGSALVVQGDGKINKPEDFWGKRIATPQLGNTQDVAARIWMRKHGFKITQLGGDVHLLPTANPDQLALFIGGQIDGAWTVEPWVTRLELEGKGKIFLEEKDALTTVLSSSVKILKEQPAVVKKFVEAHVELTKWIAEHPLEAKAMIRAELKELTKREFPETVADHAWPRLKVTNEVTLAEFQHLFDEAKAIGFLKGSGDLSQLFPVLK